MSDNNIGWGTILGGLVVGGLAVAAAVSVDDETWEEAQRSKARSKERERNRILRDMQSGRTSVFRSVVDPGDRLVEEMFSLTYDSDRTRLLRAWVDSNRGLDPIQASRIRGAYNYCGMTATYLLDRAVSV
tara:strand:- start:2571 stop:2960 length:390 start_codon:yes stop_codon:yes gene_type:complete